jgi:hypothetical protein
MRKPSIILYVMDSGGMVRKLGTGAGWRVAWAPGMERNTVLTLLMTPTNIDPRHKQNYCGGLDAVSERITLYLLRTGTGVWGFTLVSAI